MKSRNYSFQSSKRLPLEKMSLVNGIRIPSMPGSCYHAIMCALAESKDRLVSWDKLSARVEKYMRQFGGDEAWEKFKHKSKVKTFQQRIKDNTHTLTRCGRDCYGYRLHEQGMVIYFFIDGAVLFTGGTFTQLETEYKVEFADGKELQVRYRGTTMTFKEYKRFLDAGLITPSGKCLDNKGIKACRAKLAMPVIPVKRKKTKRLKKEEPKRLKLTIVLDETYDQATANRLEGLGLIVTSLDGNEVRGTILADKIDDVISDIDVLDVVVE